MNPTGQLCFSLLQVCKSLKQIKQVHALIFKSGLDSDPFIAGKLILSCAVSVPNSLDHARGIFRHLPDPDVFTYNTLARGISESSDTPQDAFHVFVEMRRRALAPDSFSFAFVLKSAANLKDLVAGIQLHCQALACGFSSHLFVGTTLTSMYGECGYVDCARKMFDEIPQPNVVAWNALLTACLRCQDVSQGERVFDRMPYWDLTSWNVMLAGYAKAGKIELARELFSKMPVKDDVSWSTIIVGFVQTGHFMEAFDFFRDLKRERVRMVNEVSLTGVLSACAQAGALEFGKVIHAFVEKAGLNWIVSVNNALLDTYSKCGNMSMASLVFNRMMPETRSVVSWTVMMAGLAMHGYGKEALHLFSNMEESGIQPDEITFISLLYACSHAGLVKEGLEYFDKMVNVHGIEPAMEHYGCIVDLYGRSGSLQKAYDFILRMPIDPSAVIWRTLLGACSVHGNTSLAEQVKFRLNELEPFDPGDHVLLSNVYATSGKWNDVVSVRRSMSSQRIKKPPGWSMIEVDKTVYTFLAGEARNEITERAYVKLKEIMARIKVDGGYAPETTSVMYDIEDEEKEDAVCKHSEKLAVAFGMIDLCEGKSLRVVKNLRICRDCHSVMCVISRVYGVEIVVRDRSRFHTFKDGLCSCGDDPKKVEHLMDLEGAKGRLRLFRAELTEEGSFDSAVAGYVVSKMSGEGKLVCVTSASGYIASWVVKLLLLHSYSVNATIRHLNDPKKVEHLMDLEGAKGRLKLFRAELTEEGSFDSAVAGRVGVFHTVSPGFLLSHDPRVYVIIR
ncbi:hypothetical protein V2J09_012714 [Rumex salicifolius]